MERLNRRPSNEQGQAIIELALTLPLLLVIVLGIFDFGFMFQRYEVVTNAAREGSRVGVLPGYAVADAQARAEQYLNAGGLGTGTPDHTANCSSATVTAGQRCTYAVVTTSPAFGPSGKTVKQITTTVSYDHEFAFVGPLMQLFSGSLGTTRLKAISTMRLESN
jgi:Flp pilus assembly protein TadG